MYKNILFDLGGVLVEYNPRMFLLERFVNEKLEQKLYNLTFGSQTWIQLDKGELSREQANKIMLSEAAKTGHKFEINAIINDWHDILTTKEDTSKLLRILKINNYNLYYASNIAFDTLQVIKRRHFWPLFNGGIASCEIGTAKPEHEFFEKLLNTYKLNPNETIFIDDTLKNVLVAREFGINAIHFKNAAELAMQLHSFGVQLKLGIPK